MLERGSRFQPLSSEAEEQQNGHGLDIESGGTATTNGRPGLVYEPNSPGWRICDIDWRFVFVSQHYGTIVWGALIVIALAVSHWVQKPHIRPFLIYDASISQINTKGKNTVPSAAAVVAPFGILIINLVFYEFFVFRFQNKTITHAVATALHFLLDAACCFLTCVFITEVTKFGAGRLRPDFLQTCNPVGGLDGQSAQLHFATDANTVTCQTVDIDSRKSFPSGHSSAASVTMVYSIVYGLWSGYFRSYDASFMGLNRHTGWRGGHRFLREFGHGAYLVWNISQFGFFWAVGVTRFTDNKHNVSDIVAGWFLGTCIGLIYALRAVAIHKYVALEAV